MVLRLDFDDVGVVSVDVEDDEEGMAGVTVVLIGVGRGLRGAME